MNIYRVTYDGNEMSVLVEAPSIAVAVETWRSWQRMEEGIDLDDDAEPENVQFIDDTLIRSEDYTSEEKEAKP